ncbi:MAG: hypothetical protein C0501_16190 [Isosphaera sp.]|nr:hypothetical protein [Isosphaera sp.]
MSSAVDLACPNCEKPLKVPPAVFGKRVKCKHCDHPFVAADPAAARPAKPARPGARPEPAPPPPPAPAPAGGAALRFADDDDGPQKIEVVQESDTPRCPHCAQELDPPDAKVCIHCGFNNQTRTKAETKRVWAPTTEDWIIHLGPGVAAVATIISLIALNVTCFLQMREWLTGTFLDMEEKDAAGRQRFYIHPAAFKFAVLAMTIPAVVAAGRFAYDRLVRNNRPEEKVKK